MLICSRNECRATCSCMCCSDFAVEKLVEESHSVHAIILFVKQYRGRQHCYDRTQPSFSKMSVHQDHNINASIFRLNLEIFIRLHKRPGDSVWLSKYAWYWKHNLMLIAWMSEDFRLNATESQNPSQPWWDGDSSVKWRQLSALKGEDYHRVQCQLQHSSRD